MRFRNPAGHSGLLSNLLGIGNSLASFFESRIGLLGQEAKGALTQVVVLLVCLVAAALLCGVGFIFLIAGLVIAVANALHISWIWIALGAALLQFLIALVCLLIARTRMKKPLFRASLAELKKDREWLKNLDTKTLSRK